MPLTQPLTQPLTMPLTQKLTQPKAISSAQGFTLVELVIVIIVLGVLSVTALPKLTSKSAFEDYAVRDQLIARLRLVQLQGMNADPASNATENACYWLVVTSSCFYHKHTVKSGGSCASPAPDTSICTNDSYNQYNAVIYSGGMLTPANYRFDLQGKLIVNNALITTSLDIDINGDNNLAVSIETEGYVHD